jgi:Ser/Thr protein kinase RdoA (MazF antagonist)
MTFVPDQPPAPLFDATLERMFQRQGVDTLAAHLEEILGTHVSKMRTLDVGVFRVDRKNDTPLIARLFSKSRTPDSALGDLAALEQLQEAGIPAERCVEVLPLSVYEGQPLLLTHFVRGVPTADRPKGHPIAALGRVLGRLHRLPPPTGAANRPAGALHHFADGTPADELLAARGWLSDIIPRVAPDDRGHLATLDRTLADADDAAGLPAAFIHPDPVPKNTVFTAEGPVLVDWTGAGYGPRLASLAQVLLSGWAGPPLMRGYARLIELDDDERRRLPDLLMTRALIDMVFRVCLKPETAPAQVKRLDALRKRVNECSAAVLATT